MVIELVSAPGPLERVCVLVGWSIALSTLVLVSCNRRTAWLRVGCFLYINSLNIVWLRVRCSFLSWRLPQSIESFSLCAAALQHEGRTRIYGHGSGICTLLAIERDAALLFCFRS